MAKTLYTTLATTNFTVPAGVIEVVAEGWAPGGAGYGSSGFLPGGGGGSGGYVRKTLAVTPGDTITCERDAGYTEIRANGFTFGATAGATSTNQLNAAGGEPYGDYDVGYSGTTGTSPGKGGNAPKPDGTYATTTSEEGGVGPLRATGSSAGAPGGAPGAGGGGTADYSYKAGGAGGRGQIRLTYFVTIVRKQTRHSVWL